MKKGLTIAVGGLLLLSSCGTYTASGAYTGATFGNVIGSAIGGITGGWRGHDVGSLIGTVGGAVVGAAVGQAMENAESRKYEQARSDNSYPYDDRIVFDDQPADRTDTYAVSSTPKLEIRNARIEDTDHDGALVRGEQCVVRFEIHNTSDRPVFDVRPMVMDVTGNKHVNVSPNLTIESIQPHQGLRYTATILADNRLKNGEIVVRVSVAVGQREVLSQSQEFRLTTRKK